MVFSGSSILHIHKGEADLSRRAVIYELSGLSFREFLQLEAGVEIPPVSLQELLESHRDIAFEIVSKVKPLAYFSDYLNYGHYPYYKENPGTYHQKLLSTINLILEVDLPQIRKVNLNYLPKLKKLLWFIAHSVPYQPNISKLASMIEVSRDTVSLYLEYLQDAKLLKLLHPANSGYASLSKPAKVYLDHPNLIYAIASQAPSTGSVRECFFLNQVGMMHSICASKQVDFLVDEEYHFEVGGKNKKDTQLQGLNKGFIAMDDIEIGEGNCIPLWLFGCLY